MAKNLIRNYVFSPGGAGSGTIRVPGRIQLERILLITNTTKNTVIYNFADPTYTNTTVTFVSGNDSTNFPTIAQREDGYTIITLGYSTSGQSASDKLQILVEDSEYGMRIRP